MFSFFIIFSIFILLTFCCPLIRTTHWFVRGFDFLRVQIAIITIFYIALGFYIFSFSIEFIGILILGALNLGFDIYRIGPYTKLFSSESKKGKVKSKNIKILSGNVFIDNTDYERLISLVQREKPDILLLLETDNKWSEGVSQFQREFKYCKLIPKDNTYGMLLFSNYKLEALEVNYFIDERVPSIYTRVELDADNFFHLFCVHPRPPRPNEASSLQRDGELVAISKRIQKLNSEATLVIGDLNDVAWSHTTRLFKRLSGLLDPRVGRGFYNTFPAKYKLLACPLDHVFHSKELELTCLSVLEDIGSDHLPIKVAFNLVDRKLPDQKREEPGEDDRNEAAEISDEASQWEEPSERVDS